MMSARNEILNSIREHLAASAPFDAVHSEHHGHGEVAEIVYPSSELSSSELAEMFRENLMAIGGNCVVVESKDEALDGVRSILAERNIKRVAISDSAVIQSFKPGLEGIEILEAASKDELFICDAGITGVQWGIAETGTLVLESNNRERNRLASLVPPVHIAVLEAALIRQRMSEVLAEISTEQSRAVTFITGPSRTSDIELTLAIGVHGPGELHVIIVGGFAEN